MISKPVFTRISIILFLFIFIFGSNFSYLNPVKGETTRTGAWVDTINVNVVDINNAVSSIKSGDIDMYALGPFGVDVSGIQNDPSIDISSSIGLFFDLTFNPAEFYDNNKLNPFAVNEIREAMNWLIDRDYINQTVCGGNGFEKFFPIEVGSPDYLRYSEKISELESYYSYNFELAETTISNSMVDLGATKINNKWIFNNEPVVLTILIRNDSDGTRIPIGDYVANQLELIGFDTYRYYLPNGEAVPIWMGSDPAEGQWHVYTGAWNSGLARDSGDMFEFFYSPNSYYGFSQLWQSYDPVAEFAELIDKLAHNLFSSLQERDLAFERALELSLQNSVRIWLIDSQNFVPRRATTTFANDLSAGETTPLWPFTIRNRYSEGGIVNIGIGDIFFDAWNPIVNPNWAPDEYLKQATKDSAFLPDPNTGLFHPQRVERAEIFANPGLPIQKTLDWVDLTFTEDIVVPDDAWVNWDAVNQVFLTAEEVDPENLNRNALVKSIVYYPTGLFSSVTWHDSSPLDLADFILPMIMKFDRGNPDSPIYDPSDEENLNNFMNYFKGVKIISEDPLIIETYLDTFKLDAELNVTSWWPENAPWHTTGLAAWAEEQGLLAFSWAKETEAVPITNFLYGPSINILANELTSAFSSLYVPYEATMNNYLSEAEIGERWNNLINWYNTHNHFWVGSGPFYINYWDWEGKSISLQRFENFPDSSDKWERFQEQSTHTLALNFSDGAPGSSFIIVGQGYSPNTEATIQIFDNEIGTVFTDSNGGVSFSITVPNNTDTGLMELVVSADQTYSVWINIDPVYPIRPRIETNVNFNLPLYIETVEGENVEIQADTQTYVSFSTVFYGGETWVEPATETPPNFTTLLNSFNLQTTASFDTAQVCLYYDDSGLDPLEESLMQLLHFENEVWVNVTDEGYPDVEQNRICGTVSSFSPFALIVPEIPLSIREIYAPLEPLPVNTLVNVSASIQGLYPDKNYVATWNWGDGTNSKGLIDLENRSIIGDHNYALPGIYTLTLNITDEQGNMTTREFQYIVIFEQSGGFVTGGGWITTQENKINFGINARYPKDSNVPDGQMEIGNPDSDWKFKNSSYQWFAIFDNLSMLHGVGNLNGEDGYGFVFSALDSDIDKIRIKIWELDTGFVVFDTQPGSSNYALPTTPLGGGSIVIH